MLRAFLVLLAVLLAVFAYVFGRPWLYAGAGVPLAGALGLTVWKMWTTYERHQRPSSRRPSGPTSEDDELEELGIVDVRPKEASDDAVDETGGARPNREDPASTDDVPVRSTPRTGGPTAALPDTQPAPSLPDPVVAARNGTSTPASLATAPPEPERAPTGDAPSALRPLLESARAALGVHTVCLLAQEAVALKYRVVACASAHDAVRQDGTFETRRPLLTASMSRQSVSVRALDDDLRADLGYYEAPPSELTQMALAPVHRPGDASTVFLLVDATDAVDLGASRVHRLLDHYVDMADLLLDEDELLSEDQRVPQATDRLQSETAVGPGAQPSSAASEAAADEPPRPRHEVIAEAIADAPDGNFALALVHLNRAEAMARQGDDAVATAERRLRTRLEQAAPGRRIEPFGELTYGIFVQDDIDDVEAWAADLQDVMGEETGLLEGGVSVGVAVQSTAHADPQRLRDDATEALREAYETGTCTVIA